MADLQKRLKRYCSVTFRPSLASDNLNETLKLNRLIAHPLFLPLCILLIDITLIILFNFCVNVLCSLPQMIAAPADLSKYINYDQIHFKLDEHGEFVKGIYAVASIILIILDIRLTYLIRLSFSEKAMNKGNNGTSRWTTIKEIMMQYKEIEMKASVTKKLPVKDEEIELIEIGSRRQYKLKEGEDEYKVLKVHHDSEGKPTEKIVRVKTNYFDGKGGMPVARWRDKLYIDYQTTNNLFLGATRSGKGEMFVFTMIDIFSRAKEQINRPTMIIFDPKLELYKSSFQTLRDRDYKVRLLNLDNPMKSAGYNPLQIVAEYYKQGKIDEAQQLAKSFAFSIFNSNQDTQEAIWKNTATDLFTALIISIVSDCIEADENNNDERNKRYNLLRSQYDECDEEEQEERREIFSKVYFSALEKGEDYLGEDYVSSLMEIGIPDEIITEDGEYIEMKFSEVHSNEKKINCFSVLNFFKELVDTTSESAGREKAGEKKAETALDDYFNQRPELDYAKALYASIKSAGDRTKGSIYVNMQSALTIFSQDNIARLSAESDINIKDLGFDKENPTAVFIGLPTEDKSNHFFAVNFVTQVFQYLWKLSKEGNNKLDREVTFILDEFGNMPTFDNFDGMVTNCLGAGMSFNIFIQSYNQLHAKYEMDMDTIKDNFANQFYILAVGQESANEFSEQLGNKTIIEVQRSGSAFGLNKNIMENNKERPLLFPAELQNLKEGETALIRASKRSDRAGAGIRSYPILDEYMEHIYFWHYINIFIKKIIIKRVIKHDLLKDRDTGDDLAWQEEMRYWASDKKRWQGTAFLYRWQYNTDDFPNPTEIEFNKVFKEKGRENINYQDMVVDTNEIKKKIKVNNTTEIFKKYEKKMGKVFYLKDLSANGRAKFNLNCSKYLGEDYYNKLRLHQDMSVADVFKIISKYIEENIDGEELEKIKEDGFLGNINRILIRN